jgi:hypothetical protein
MDGAEVLIIAALAAMGYYLYTHGALTQLQQLNPNIYAQSQPQGVVTVARPPMFALPQTTGIQNVGTGVAIASVGLGAAQQIMSSLGKGTSSIPIVGAVVGVVSSIIGMIGAHHQAALANEGKVLNQADPGTYQAFMLVAQAVQQGQITTMDQVNAYLDQIVADWYLQVKSIQRGTWHLVLNQPNPRPPDPCNAACSVGHNFIESGAQRVRGACNDMIYGAHGTLILPAIPPYMTQSGVPQMTMVY